MDRALFAAASGMAAQQRNLDTIADNLANSGVIGFKGSVASFAELVEPGGVGEGTVALGSRVLFAQGKLARSAGPFDLAIDGPGFFEVVDARGRHAFTRDGQFSRAADGTLRNASITARGASNSRRCALRRRQRERHRTRDLPRRFAHDRAYYARGVSVSRSPACNRRSNLRSDARSGQAGGGRRRLTRWAENSIWHARRVERNDYRCDDADSDGAARVRSKR